MTGFVSGLSPAQPGFFVSERLRHLLSAQAPEIKMGWRKASPFERSFEKNYSKV
jgi:hypothetical protein